MKEARSPREPLALKTIILRHCTRNSTLELILILEIEAGGAALEDLDTDLVSASVLGQDLCQ